MQANTQNKNWQDDVFGTGPKKKARVISQQERKKVQGNLDSQSVSLEHCIHVLKSLTEREQGPTFWERSEFKQVRECLAVINSQPDKFSPLMRDKVPGSSTSSLQKNEKIPALTINYISSIAEFKELDDSELPILQVVSSKMDFEESSRSNNDCSIHFTHLRLCNSSKDGMMGRLFMHLAHDGAKLDKGDIIPLNSFTSLTYTPSGQEKPHRSPAEVIHTSPVHRRKYNFPRHCIEMTTKQTEEYTSETRFSLL